MQPDVVHWCCSLTLQVYFGHNWRTIRPAISISLTAGQPSGYALPRILVIAVLLLFCRIACRRQHTASLFEFIRSADMKKHVFSVLSGRTESRYVREFYEKRRTGSPMIKFLEIGFGTLLEDDVQVSHAQCMQRLWVKVHRSSAFVSHHAT